MDYELSRKALSQIEDIIRYTDKNFGTAQTEEYLNGLYYSFDLLTDNPRIGRRFDTRYRRYIYRSHYVYYQILKDKILIVSILNARLNSSV